LMFMIDSFSFEPCDFSLPHSQKVHKSESGNGLVTIFNPWLT
jgi:hypothetical protein